MRAEAVVLALLASVVVPVHRVHCAAVDADPFLRFFGDQRQETTTAVEAAVAGSLPGWLAGDLVRLGPSVRCTDAKNYSNYLDAFGRITRWQLRGDGSVAFSSRLLRTLAYNASDGLSDIPPHITQQPTEPRSAPAIPNLNVMDNTDVVAVFLNATHVLTTTDFVAQHVVDLVSLSTHPFEFTDEGLRGTWSGSHLGSYRDETTGKPLLVNWLGSEAKTPDASITMQVFTLDEHRSRTVVGEVKVPFLPYSTHSIAVAGHYAVVPVNPASLHVGKAGANLCLSCSYEDLMAQEAVTFHVFDLRSTDSTAAPVASLALSQPNASFFSFHFVNAFVVENADPDGTDEIVLDACAHLTLDGILGEHVLGSYADVADPDTRDAMPYLCDAVRRVTLPLGNDSATASFEDWPVVDAQGHVNRLELLSPSPAKQGSDYCVAYGVTNHAFGSSRYEDMGVVKLNRCEPQTPAAVWHEPGVYVGEPLFVADPNGQAEDDGVLLVVTRNNSGVEDATNLLVLNASTMALVASVAAPFPLPSEFHGAWRSSDAE